MPETTEDLWPESGTGDCYTPGPWESRQHQAAFPIVTDANGDCIAIVDSRGGLASREERLASQQLIAAAPTLATLLKRAYLALNRNQWEDGETDSELSDRINDAMCNHFGSNWFKCV